MQTLVELLRVWVRDGKLGRPRVSHRREANARRSRSRVRLYDAEAFAHLIRQWRAGVRRKDVVPLVRAREAAIVDPPPAEEQRPTRPRRRGRRPGWRDPEALARDQRIVEDGRAGRYASIAELARAHGVDRSHASRVLKKAGLRA
jgi:hypothetical protein